jgi:tetratricopeptide (TPR) repeat protein
VFPKLTPLQWLLAVIFLGFYGFAVFALTRDYYLRHPPQRTAAPAAPHALPARRSAPAGVAPQTETAVDAIIGSDPKLLAQEGDRLFGVRRYDAAVERYRQALALDERDVDTRNDLGLALHYLGRSDEALEVLRTGAEMDPEFQRIWLTFGFVAAQSGRPQAARDALEQAIALDSEAAVTAEAQRMLDQVSAMEDGAE